MHNLNQTCSTCRFWTGDKAKASGQGECRRLPKAVAGIVPVMNQLTRQQQAGTVSAWPTVTASEWCGEYSAEILS